MSEVKILYSNTQQRNKINNNHATVTKCAKISEMILRAQNYKDGNLEDALKHPSLFNHFNSKAIHWQEVIERLSNYLNNTASEIHL